MTGITAAIPYGFSALAQFKWRWPIPNAQRRRFIRDLLVAVVSLVFSVLFICTPATLASRLAVLGPVPPGGAALLLGIPVYRSQRRGMSATRPRSLLPMTKRMCRARRTRSLGARRPTWDDARFASRRGRAHPAGRHHAGIVAEAPGASHVSRQAEVPGSDLARETQQSGTHGAYQVCGRRRRRAGRAECGRSTRPRAAVRPEQVRRGRVSSPGGGRSSGSTPTRCRSCCWLPAS